MSSRHRAIPEHPDKGDALGLKVLCRARHRSLDHLTLSAPRLAIILLVPVLFNVAEWMLRGALSAGWAAIFEFWIGKLGMGGTVIQKPTPLASLEITLPHLYVPAIAPNLRTWWVTVAATIIVALLTLRLPDRFLPLRYFLQFAIFIQTTAILFFAVAPDSFPYTVSGYVDNGLKTSFAFLFLLPWGHALVYYIFDFSWPSKICLTLFTLAFVVIAVPLQLTLHAYLLFQYSLLLMPLLSFVLGPTWIVFGCIALYGWAMSWDRLNPEAEAPRSAEKD